MLVLTRRLNESIIVDDNIRITVVSVAGGKVRLAIDAPRDVPVNRMEVHERIQSGSIEAPSACVMA